ncbi:MAG: AGE family epimerase/isomerase [Lachnospiraceae bacterium]|nr:AGE family epimerase/isomerase [Lachnospiraceae bacterium]
MLAEEMKKHLTETIIPFWSRLKDEEYGGFYGYMDHDGRLEQKAVKGCILNSRIVWFFSNAYLLLKNENLLKLAEHGYRFMKEHCLDTEEGGIYWSVSYDGKPEDTTKHTYNQAFAIYALSSYYDASGDEEALKLAGKLLNIIEEKCTDEIGYREAFDRSFHEIENDKLSENGVIAEKTMNTLLHVFEAYTEYYRVSGDSTAKRRLEWALDTIAEKIYNPKLRRQEVFFDREMNSIIDLHSYGHDIETAWLVDRGVDILGDPAYERKMHPITEALTAQVYKVAYDNHSLANECEKGVVDENRIWWVQAEAVVGFYNGWQRHHERKEYLQAAENIWEFIRTYVVDYREGTEWFWRVSRDGMPDPEKPIVEPWKCPYHNGRMCMEIIKRSKDI